MKLSSVVFPVLVAVQDADGDVIRCRFANSSQRECADICDGFPNAILDEVSEIIKI